MLGRKSFEAKKEMWGEYVVYCLKINEKLEEEWEKTETEPWPLILFDEIEKELAEMRKK